MIAGAVWPLLVRLAEDMNAQTIRRWWGAQFRAEFKDIRPEDRELKLKEMQFFSTIETVDELRKRNGIEPIGDVRGLMLLAELNKGAPTPTSAPGQAIEDALAKQEEEAMAQQEAAPAIVEEDAEALPPEADDGAPLEEETVKGLDILIPDPQIRETISAISSEVDLSAWKRKAIKAVKANKTAAVKFESDAIPPDEQARIREALEGAKTVADVVEVFDVQTNQRGVVGAVSGTDASLRWDTLAAPSADTARLGDEQGHVKATAVDEEVDLLIDSELSAALAWAQRASEG